ncbi:FHA domain-containing protein [Cohnella cellulosilytica]
MSLLAERNESQRERGHFKFREGRRPRVAMASAIGGIALWLLPCTALASEARRGQAAAQMTPGTLPLLAGLGIGIAVAVLAVIAFLQLTAKGKLANDAAQTAEEDDDESFDDPDLSGWDEEEASANEEAEYHEEHALTDYTIPMTRLLEPPAPAETAEGSEPMLCGIEGEHAGSCFRVLNRRLTIGRDPARCAILFPYEAVDISRVHCTLKYSQDTRVFVLEDKGSSNGTFLLSGERLKPGVKYELRSGERFSLSGDAHWFEVRDEGPRG